MSDGRTDVTETNEDDNSDDSNDGPKETETNNVELVSLKKGEDDTDDDEEEKRIGIKYKEQNKQFMKIVKTANNIINWMILNWNIMLKD